MLTLQAELERLQLEMRASGDQANAQQLKIAFLENSVAEKTRAFKETAEEIAAYQRLLKELGQVCGLTEGRNASSSHGRSSSAASQQGDVISRECHLEQDVNRLTLQARELKDENLALTLLVNKALTEILGVDQIQSLIDMQAAEKLGHRKTNSLAVKPTVQKSSTDKANKRAQSMIVSKDQMMATQEAIKNAGESSDEGGLWKKALKRMSAATWRSTTTPIVEEKAEETVSMVMETMEIAVPQPKEQCENEDQGIVDDLDEAIDAGSDIATDHGMNDNIQSTETGDDDDDQPLCTLPMGR